ncbi:TaqI-like C-terminal specificity domain-containing protein [Aerococcus viridans]
MSVYIRQHAVNIDYKVGESWVILNEIEQSIKRKVESKGIPLKEWDVKINRGILTGLNEAFIITKEKRDELIREDSKSAEIIRPILRGRDIKRYSYSFANLYVITAYKGINAIIKSDYPAIFNHLKQFEQKLKQRGQVEGKPDRPGSNQHHWTELDNNISLEKLEDLNKPKILYAEIVQTPKFYLDLEGEYAPEATSFMLIGDNLESLIKYLNSNTVAWIFKHFYAGGGLGEGFRYKKAFIEKLPIPKNILTQDNDELIESQIQNILDLNDEEIEYIKGTLK